MPHDNLDLGALIGSRICHDLISPIGAIGNGLELLLMELPASPELSLIAESVDNANARVRFFRVAFGKASQGQHVTPSEIEKILNDVSRGGRIAMRWTGTDAPNRATARAAFLAAMCLETALPLGGEITLSHSGDHWTLHATGRRITPQPDLWAHLQAPHTPKGLTAGQVQFAILPGLLAELGKQAKVTFTDTLATIQF